MADHTAVLSQHWMNILPPQPPAALGGWLLFSAVALALLVLLVVAVLWQQRPRQRALRQLRRCQRQLKLLSADNRDIACRTYQAVKQGLSIHSRETSDSVASDPRWQNFYQRLQACVFAGQAPSREQVAELIRQSRDWLKHRGNK